MTGAQPASAPTTIVLVDDHALFREGIRQIFEAQPDLRVVGEAQDRISATRIVGQLRPDVVLLDVETPGGPVTATVSQIRAASPQSLVIILAMYDRPALVHALLSHSIYAFLLKNVTRQELMAVVREARKGTDRCVLFISRETAQHLGAPTEVGRPRDADARAVVLTPREREVLTLVGLAMSNTRIAKHLSLSEGTVKRHLRNVFFKLNVRSRMEAVNKALAVGLIGRP